VDRVLNHSPNFFDVEKVPDKLALLIEICH